MDNPSCKGCGACCLWIGGADHWPHKPTWTKGRFSPCGKLDEATMLCMIYDDRPELCRTFEPGSHDCQTALENARLV